MKRLFPISLAVAAATVATAFAPSARAAEPEQPAWAVKPAEHRAGFVLGLSLGAAMGSASGYPNKATQIGDGQFHTSSGFGGGSSNTLFVMGALADYLNFGLMFTGSQKKSGDYTTKASGIGFRVEAFPFYEVAPRLRDLGITTQMGLGIARIESTDPAHANAEGVQAYVGLGVFHEWTVLRFSGSHLTVGPSLDYAAVLSRSVDNHELALTARVAFYTAK